MGYIYREMLYKFREMRYKFREIGYVLGEGRQATSRLSTEVAVAFLSWLFAQ